MSRLSAPGFGPSSPIMCRSISRVEIERHDVVNIDPGGCINRRAVEYGDVQLPDTARRWWSWTAFVPSRWSIISRVLQLPCWMIQCGNCARLWSGTSSSGATASSVNCTQVSPGGGSGRSVADIGLLASGPEYGKAQVVGAVVVLKPVGVDLSAPRAHAPLLLLSRATGKALIIRWSDK